MMPWPLLLRMQVSRTKTLTRWVMASLGGQSPFAGEPRLETVSVQGAWDLPPMISRLPCGLLHPSSHHTITPVTRRVTLFLATSLAQSECAMVTWCDVVASTRGARHVRLAGRMT